MRLAHDTGRLDSNQQADDIAAPGAQGFANSHLPSAPFGDERRQTKDSKASEDQGNRRARGEYQAVRDNFGVHLSQRLLDGIPVDGLRAMKALPD